MRTLIGLKVYHQADRRDFQEVDPDHFQRTEEVKIPEGKDQFQ